MAATQKKEANATVQSLQTRLKATEASLENALRREKEARAEAQQTRQELVRAREVHQERDRALKIIEHLARHMPPASLINSFGKTY